MKLSLFMRSDKNIKYDILIILTIRNSISI